MPRNVKELLTSAKDATELMLDLAFASVFLDEDELAREVLHLEERMSEAVHELRILCMLATRSVDDAEELAGVLGMVNAMEAIADAAEDVARITLADLGVPRELRDDLRYADEVTARVKIREGSELVGLTLRELSLPSETGMWIIAIRRDVDYEWGPDGDTTLLVGDVLFLQGPAEGVDLVRERAGGQPFHLAEPIETRLTNLDRAVDILVELKNNAEAAVSLAYSAVMFSDRALAAEVSGIEDRCDRLYYDLGRWVLRAAAEVPDEALDDLRALLQIGQSAEAIADAAQSMTRLVEDREEVPPVVRAALADTDELVGDAVVHKVSELVGRSLGELKLGTSMGTEVLALQRGGRWINKPRSTRKLQADDRLLVIGPEEGIARLQEAAGDEREDE